MKVKRNLLGPQTENEGQQHSPVWLYSCTAASPSSMGPQEGSLLPVQYGPQHTCQIHQAGTAINQLRPVGVHPFTGTCSRCDHSQPVPPQSLVVIRDHGRLDRRQAWNLHSHGRDRSRQLPHSHTERRPSTSQRSAGSV